MSIKPCTWEYFWKQQILLKELHTDQNGAELLYSYKDTRNAYLDIPDTFLQACWVLLWVYTNYNLCNNQS